MKQPYGILAVIMFIVLANTGIFAKQYVAPKYDEEKLKKEFNAFIDSLSPLAVSKDYPKAVEKLLSGDREKQIQAVKALAETGEVDVIPWLLVFLDSDDSNLRVWTGASLEKLVSSIILKRRDMSRPEVILIRPLKAGEKDLRPLAWIVLKMFRMPDDGNTHAYAATMARYLGLYDFDRELEACRQSRHPAVSDKATWALESLKQQKAYETALSNNSQQSNK